jgi:Lamin Tail Domain
VGGKALTLDWVKAVVMSRCAGRTTLMANLHRRPAVSPPPHFFQLEDSKVRALPLALSAAALAVVLVPVVPAQAAALPAIQLVKVYYNSPGSPDNGANSSLNGEYAQIKNMTRKAVSLKGWTLRDKTSAADHVYTFGAFTLGAGKTVTVRTGKGTNTSTIRYWGRSGGTFAYIWNQSADTAYVRNPSGKLIDSCSYNSSRVAYKSCL